MSALPSGISQRKLVLVVEDDPIIALNLEELLRSEGYCVAGPAMSVASALAILEHVDPDAAVLDVNLHGAKVTPVAQELANRGVPFVLTSGDKEAPPQKVFDGIPNLGKPTLGTQLVETIEHMIEGANGNKKNPPRQR